MKKERIKEIRKLYFKEIRKNHNNKNQRGLCNITRILLYNGYISYDERTTLKECLEILVPINYYSFMGLSNEKTWSFSLNRIILLFIMIKFLKKHYRKKRVKNNKKN